MKKIVLIVMIVVLVGVCALALSQVVPYAMESAVAEKEFRELQEHFDVTGEDESKAETKDPAVVVVRELKKQNPDMVGWLRIPATLVDYPVMWTPRDEQFYLYRNFDKVKTKEGTPFLDTDCDVRDPNKNLVIYGHNMKTGTMFGALMDYKKESFWREHPKIKFTTAEETETYDIFAVIQTDTKEGYFIYQMIENNSEVQFEENIREIKAMSLYETGITPDWGDKLIILSTCEYSRANGRLLVVGLN